MPQKRRRLSSGVRAIFSTLLPLFAAASMRAAPVEISAVDGQRTFTIQDASVADLSGIAWAGGELFHVVSDQANVVRELTLDIDPTTGRIVSGLLAGSLPLKVKARDVEGIAYVSATRRLFVSSEAGGVFSFSVQDRQIRRETVPPIFAQARRNLGLESLTWNATAQQFWIANEEALAPDGPVSSASAGTLVRLQRLDARFRPTGQFAWRTEPASFRFGQAGSCVSDLCALPGGELLVLERTLTGSGLRLAIYLAGFEGATDVSKAPSLAQAKFVAAKKTLLFEQLTGFTNFEGLTLGPPLADGSHSLVVIADSNSGSTHTLLPLKIRLPERAPRAGTRPRNSHTPPRDRRSHQPADSKPRAR